MCKERLVQEAQSERGKESFSYNEVVGADAIVGLLEEAAVAVEAAGHAVLNRELQVRDLVLAPAGARALEGEEVVDLHRVHGSVHGLHLEGG